MITDIQPLRHLWGVVLPGTERRRGIVLSRGHYTGRRPRQGELARPLERATRLIPPARLVTVLTRETAAGAGPVLAAVPGLQRCLQPVSRGTAPELFLAALNVLQQDPHAVVAMLPADHLT